jgi:hypothetical protein
LPFPKYVTEVTLYFNSSEVVLWVVKHPGLDRGYWISMPPASFGNSCLFQNM